MSASSPVRVRNPRRSRRRARPATSLAVGLGLLLGGAWIGAGAIGYDRLSRLNPDCGGGWAGQTPDRLEARDDWGRAAPRFDAARYRFRDYVEVEFGSRSAAITIRAWWAPPRDDDAGPAVILVHGVGSCRRDPVVLLPAGMLHRAGMGVLVVDLRDHGSSAREDGRWAGGVEEQADVLGAWDWLVGERYAPQRIGAFGASMGGAAVAMAMGQEPRLAAAFLDSAPANITTGAGEFAEDSGYPAFLVPAAFLAARLISGDDLASLSPDTELARLGGRPLDLVHGTADTVVRVHHVQDLAAAAAAGGTAVEPWIVEGAGHVEAVFLDPDRYEERLVGFFARALGRP